MTTKVVENKNGSTEYFVEGNGEVIVFLHGAGASAIANWKSSIDLFSKNKKVISINLPGAGNTNWNKETLSITDLVTIVKSVVDAEKCKLFTIIGYSAGSIVALAYGGTYPNQVKKIVAISPWLKNARQKFFFNFWAKLFNVDKNLFARYNTLNALSLNSQNQMNDEAFEGTTEVFSNTGFNDDLPKLIDMLSLVDIEQFLPQITSEVKIIGFTSDLVAPIDSANEISKKINHAIFNEIQAGHAGPWEATEKMNEEIANFI